MSFGRPETLCYLSGERDSSEVASKQIMEAAGRDLPSSVMPRMEDYRYRKDLVSSMSCRLQIPLNGVETPTTTGIL